MNRLFKILIPGLLFSMVLLTAGIAADGPRTRIERTITREFQVTSEPQIRLNTQKGEIKFQTWDENRVLVEITIVSEGDSKSQAENGLDMVQVIAKKTGDMVHIETDFEGAEENNSFWSLIRFWEENLKVTVDMVINVPVNSTFDVTHRYGDVILPNIQSGTVDIKYGSLNCGHVRDKLELVAAYSKGSLGDMNQANVLLQYSDFGFSNIGYGEVQVEYSKFRALDSHEMVVNSKYSSLTVGTVNEFSLDGKFDKIEIEEADNVIIDTKYTAINIGKVSSNIKIANSYQSTKVRYISPEFQDVQVVGKYGNCVLGFQGSPNANFELETKYGNIRVPENATIIAKDDSSSSKSVKGQLGRGGEKIYVVNSYGNITLE